MVGAAAAPKPTLTISAPVSAMRRTAIAVASTSLVGSPMVALTGTRAGTQARIADTVACGSAPSAPATGSFASTMSAPSAATSSASRSSVTLASILAVWRTFFIDLDWGLLRFAEDAPLLRPHLLAVGPVGYRKPHRNILGDSCRSGRQAQDAGRQHDGLWPVMGNEKHRRRLAVPQLDQELA